MADYISQITLPDNNTYDLRDKNLKLYTGSCSTAAATAIKDVITDGAFTLTKGVVIFVNFTNTNTAAVGNLKLKINSEADSNAKPIKYLVNGNDPANIPGAGYLRANQTYMFRYDGTNWVADLNYYTYSNNFANMIGHYNNILARKDIAAESLIVGDSSGYEKVASGVTFDLAYPIVWCTANITANASNYANMYLQHYDRNIATGAKSGFTSTANKVIYLIVTINGNIATIDSNIITDTLPSSDDGKVYISLGKLGAQSTGANYFFLYPVHPMFWYKNGAIREYGGGSGIKDITRSGTTFTATRDDGSTFTFTQQDNAGVTKVSTGTGLTGGDITTTGTVSLANNYGDTKNPYASKTKNYVLAAPSNANGVPSFRALAAADIPNLSWTKITSDKPTTLSGYGITDAKIASGVITLGSNTITPITSIADLTGSTITAANLRTNLGLTAPLRFIGKATTDISESTTTAPTVTGVTNYVPEIGDVVLDKNSDAEYVCIAKTTANNTTTYTWELLGRSGSWATSTHTHGNITNGGLLGAANMAVVTDGSKKITTADLSVSDPTAATTTSTTFIDTISQNAQGKITATKKTLPTLTNVTQSSSSEDKEFPIILKNTNNSTNETNGVKYDGEVTVNPNKSRITATTIQANSRLVASKAISQIITGTGVAASYTNSTYYPAKWTFNTGLTATDGDIFTIKIPVAGHDYGVFMSVDNGLHYYPVVLNGTGRITTHYPVNTYITVIFESTGSAASMFAVAGQTSSTRITVTGGVWRVLNYYDSNSNDTGYYHRRIYPNLKAGGAIHPYSIIMQLPNGKWSGITATAPNNPGKSNVSPVATGKAASTSGYMLGHVLLMYANATYADTNNIGTYNIWSAHTGLIDARYSFNLANSTGNGFVAYTPVYIVGTVSDGLFHLDTTKWWTQTLPSSDDGKVYIYIGDAYDWYRLTFTEDKPIYWYKDGAVRLYSGASEYALSAPLSGISGADDLKAIEAISGNTGLLKKTAANTWTLDTNTYLTSHQSLAAYAKLASPKFTGTPTAPTAADGTNTTQIATTAFVMSQFKYNDAMEYKGVVNSDNDLPINHIHGWTYKVATAGTYAGIACEVGDLIICNTDGTSTNNAHWNVIQNNIDGAVFKSSNTFTDGQLLIADGSNGKVKTTNSLSGPFRIYTSADATKAFKISRTNGDGEFVAHWVDNGTYHIDYTNDEYASSIKLRIINVDTEGSDGSRATDYTYTFDHQGNFSGNAATATRAKYFTGTINGRITIDANNPADTLLGDYGSSNSTITNLPSGWKYGSLLTLGANGSYGSLSGQFAWDVQHNTDKAGRLWFRTNGVISSSSSGWKSWNEIAFTDSSITGNAATATAIQTAGTTAQFYRGDNSWSNIIKQTANAALGVDTNLKIGTARKDLNFDIGNGSGTGINDGYAGGITWGNGTAAYAGIYYQSSGSYGTRLILATTNLYTDGAKARMIIQNNGYVGIGTLTPSTLLQVAGSSTLQHLYTQTDATYDIGATATRWRSAYLTTSLLVGAKSTITAYNSNALGSFVGPGVISSCVTAAGNGYYLMGGGAQYGRWYIQTIGTASNGSTQGVQGISTFELGNATARAAATDTTGGNNSRGRLVIFGANQYYTEIYAQSNGYRTCYLPNYNNTMYLVHAGDNSAVGSGTQPVYVAENGRITASTNTVGDAYTPVYSNAGVLTATAPVQYNTFTIVGSDNQVELKNDAYTEDTYVLTIVITSGEANINAPITWTSSTGKIKLQTGNVAVSGDVSGYILTARGTSLVNLT